MSESVFEVIKNVIVEIKDISEDLIKLESRFEEDLEADSLDIVEMLMLLEEKYDILIPEEDAEPMKTVQNVVDYIEAKIK